MVSKRRPVSSDEAKSIGLVDDLAGDDLVDRAMARARELAASGDFRRIRTAPIETPAKLPDADIGHLSTAVDKLMVRAILEGAKLDLRKGLELEAKLFGEVVKTEDMKIGITNFMKNGPRSKAEFVNR